MYIRKFGVHTNSLRVRTRKKRKKFKRLIKWRIVKREDQKPFTMLGLLFISFHCATQFGIWDPPTPKIPRDPRGAQRDETAGGNLPFVIFSRDCTSCATRVHRRQDVVRRGACNYAIWIAMSLAAAAALCDAKREIFRIGGRITFPPCILGNSSSGDDGGGVASWHRDALANAQRGGRATSFFGQKI